MITTYFSQEPKIWGSKMNGIALIMYLVFAYSLQAGRDYVALAKASFN